MTNVNSDNRSYAYGIPCFTEVNFDLNVMYCMICLNNIIALYDPSLYGYEYYPLLF